ncbi:sensor histidine kinase [Pseudonocardia lacus]|uniref:sensor histidine kinase n=1 Tax=Pseudonocardia lacus TaxID=2835865 RepID=UPI0027E2F619|nr:histidine kinase [Pseudonocardia lacus]
MTTGAAHPASVPWPSRVTAALRTGLGLALGTATAGLHLLLLVPALLALCVPAGRRALPRAAAAQARRELVRVDRFLGEPFDADRDVDGRRAARYLLARMPAGLVGGTVLVLLLVGVVFAVLILWSWLSGTPFPLEEPAYVISALEVGYYTPSGVVLLYLALAGLAGVARWERSAARRLLAPTREEQLASRVTALAESRDAVVAAVDDERRRIERDLHDGVQQRLVALGMLLGRARRHPEQLDLVVQAHEQAQRALVELRDVSWRVYPAALDTDGLATALEAVAERAPLPVRIDCALDAEPPPAVRAVAWFVVCEAVTNAAKHSGARQVRVDVRTSGPTLRAVVSDDGRGGADPSGGGLAGLARRVAAADGSLAVSSPAGGPTEIRAELPCG